jgi:hypothetical protein
VSGPPTWWRALVSHSNPEMGISAPSRSTPVPVRPARPPQCGTCGRCSRCRRWTEPEDALVDALLGICQPGDIAARLNARFGIDRSACAVTQRIKRRHRSRWMEGLSLRDLERIFGVDHRVIVRWWVLPGLLVGRRWSGRGPPPRLAL